MFRLLFLTYTFILLTGLSAWSQLYTFRNYNHKDGLTMASVLSVVSSSDGSVLIGTAGSGIMRYDGKEFTELNSGEKYNNHVSSLQEANGEIYFTSRYYGLYKYSQGKAVRLIKPTEARGEWNKVFVWGEQLIGVTDFEIVLLDQKILKRLKQSREKITVHQFIATPEILFILSSKGNFVLKKGENKLLSLSTYLGNRSPSFEPAFGYYSKGTLNLIDKNLNFWYSVIFNEKGRIFSTEEKKTDSPLYEGEKVISTAVDSQSDNLIVLTSYNEIVQLSKNKSKRIIQNYDEELAQCLSISCDLNGDIWLASEIKGLYKVSYEPFTKIRLHPIYSLPNIMSLHRSDQGDILISTDDSITYIGDIRNPNGGFREFNIRTYAFCERADQVLCGTDKGIMSFNKIDHSLRPLLLTGTAGKKITMLALRDKFLYAGIAGEGVKKFNLETGKEIFLPSKERSTPDHFYTSQYLPTLGWQVFGTNNGVFYEETETGKLKRLKKGDQNGSYAGVSTKDVYGNVWITGEKGITGILQNGEIVLLNDPRLFNSTLFYTLNSDNYGNLIIGTNKGITILQMNEQGKVVQKNAYTGQTGFSGYETNMRSQFQEKNTIFVGTVEGLYSINTDVLRNFPKPTAPVIERINKKNREQENSFVFQFNTNNPKIPHLLYSYRIVGFQDEWTDLSESNRVFLSNLPNGSYVIEVKSSYDGRIYSDVGEYKFQVSLPFWRTRWFIVVLILSVVLINIYFIQKRKTFDGGNFFRTRDMLVELNMTPTILFFAFAADVVANYIAPLIDPEIPQMLGLSFGSGFLLLSLFLIAKNAEKTGNKEFFRSLLIMGYSVVIGHYIAAAYISGLSTFYVLPLAIIPTLATYVFERLRHVIIQNLILLIICCVMVVYLDGTAYNKFLFLFMILISCFISIFVTYLRYDSLEKLIFVSGIVNKGNVQVVAFNDQGVITYVSENIGDIIPAGQDELVNQHISILNNYLPEEGGYRNVDLTKQFYDGQKYLSPMIANDQSINWIEWSCKFFSENVRVILGQNVSDKMELENTYELLVENAEDLIYQCDVNGSLKFVNTRMKSLLQQNGETLENKSSLEFVAPDYRATVESFYREHFELRKKTSYLEFPIVTKNGEIRWFGQHVTTVFRPGSKGHINGFLALARDITEKRDQQYIIEDQRDSITSSITYAQRIQLNLLPTEKEFDRSFNEHFVIYRPKDIVSGDFYWLHRMENRTILALGDCTGHGVPGAFMTLLGINLLNTVVLEGRVTEPSMILNEMDKKLTAALKNETDSLKDGIEITVCCIDHDTNQLSYACAGSRFLIYGSNGFNMYKGDIKHIGDESLENFRGYITHFVHLDEESQVILMTDGFQDQFGGARNKRFSFRRVLELFEANIRLPFSEQRSMIEEEFELWKHEFEQTDDVTVISFRTPRK